MADDFLTRQKIEDEIERIVKFTKGSKATMIGELINMVYFEMLAADDQRPLFWLRDFDDSLSAKAPATITGISAANPGIITAASHGLATDDLISLHSIVETVELNDRLFRAVAASDDTLTLKDMDGNAISTSAMTAYATSGGTVAHRGVKLASTSKNVEKIISAAFHGYDPMKIITDPKRLEGTTKYWGANGQRPEICMQIKQYVAAGTEVNWLMWSPGADQQYLALRYWFEKRVSPLADDADVPLLPPRFHHTIVAGVVARMLEYGAAQVEGAVIWPRIYTAQTQQLVDFNRNFYKNNEPDNMDQPFGL